MSPERRSVACASAAVAAYGGALATVVAGYGHALDSACPDGAPAPLPFWPLLAAAVVLAGAAYTLRPRQRDERGARSSAEIFAVFVVIAVPLAAVVTVIGYEVAYACWE